MQDAGCPGTTLQSESPCQSLGKNTREDTCTMQAADVETNRLLRWIVNFHSHVTNRHALSCNTLLPWAQSASQLNSVRRVREACAPNRTLTLCEKNRTDMCRSSSMPCSGAGGSQRGRTCVFEHCTMPPVLTQTNINSIYWFQRCDTSS